jgi:hypothetical protein
MVVSFCALSDHPPDPVLPQNVQRQNVQAAPTTKRPNSKTSQLQNIPTPKRPSLLWKNLYILLMKTVPTVMLLQLNHCSTYMYNMYSSHQCLQYKFILWFYFNDMNIKTTI